MSAPDLRPTDVLDTAPKPLTTRPWVKPSPWRATAALRMPVTAGPAVSSDRSRPRRHLPRPAQDEQPAMTAMITLKSRTEAGTGFAETSALCGSCPFLASVGRIWPRDDRACRGAGRRWWRRLITSNTVAPGKPGRPSAPAQNVIAFGRRISVQLIRSQEIFDNFCETSGRINSLGSKLFPVFAFSVRAANNIFPDEV